METALAAVYTGHKQPFALRYYPIVEPPAGYARLKLIASGVCGTDVHIHDGILGADPAGSGQIIGHEFVGAVDAIAPEDAASVSLEKGTPVIACIALPCGKCPLCLAGDSANCVNMGVTNGGDPAVAPYFHGGYAEYNFSPVGTLVPIPASIDPKAAAVFACAGPTALHAFKLAARAGIDPAAAKLAIVQGLGPVGLFSALYLAAQGVTVLAVTGRSVPERAALAREFGITGCLALSEGGEASVTAHILEMTGDLGADLCVEASGNPAAFAQGMNYLRNRGVYLVPGQYSVSGGVPVSPETITFKALQIFGSSQYDMDDIRTYLAFLEAHPALTETILRTVTAYPVSKVNEAFADIRAGKNVKTLLVSED